MEMQIGLSAEGKEAIANGLIKFLADSYVLYLKTQNFHWNVMGKDFFSHHLFFEKQYEELQEALDEIAERIRALGYYVPATLASFKKLASIPEDDKLLTANDMLFQLLSGHETLIREGRKLGDLAEQEGDHATVDLLGRRLNAHEKFAWMVRSHF